MLLPPMAYKFDIKFIVDKLKTVLWKIPYQPSDRVKVEYLPDGSARIIIAFATGEFEPPKPPGEWRTVGGLSAGIDGIRPGYAEPKEPGK